MVHVESVTLNRETFLHKLIYTEFTQIKYTDKYIELCLSM